MTEPTRLAALAKRYRAFALEARLSAATAHSEILRDEFLAIAEHWEALVREAAPAENETSKADAS